MDSSNFWKLDKIDKIGIALIFIVFALYSTFSCFASEVEDVSVLTLNNSSFNYLRTQIVYSDTFNVYYIPIESGYTYTITNISTSAQRYIGFFNDVEIGSSIEEGFDLQAHDSFSFNGGAYNYLFVGTSSSSLSINVTREKIEGMSGSVDLLAGDVGFNLWESFSNTIVYALPITITCFGIYVICGFIQKFSKGA